MTDPQPAGAAPASTDPAQAKPPAEWKPEPRQWTWKDLFTAPMLAFKPKCMAVSAATLVTIGVLSYIMQQVSGSLGDTWQWPVYAVYLAVVLAVFGLGGTLVAVFMKADLLDDEFLSFGEAFAKFKGRALAAVAVPLFLAVLVVGVHGLLVWLPTFIASIPYAGGALYGLLYPLGFIAALFAILLLIAAVFGLFVFPAIVAIRQHGWFDNVVDTVEAVGTRPHILVACIALTLAFSWITVEIATRAAGYLHDRTAQMPAWGSETKRSDPQRVEDRSREISERALRWMDPQIIAMVVFRQPIAEAAYEGNTGFLRISRPVYDASDRRETDGYYRWGPGLVGGFWQTVIGAMVLGYCLNLFIGGGMLTYLLVREDDYWDDEDLEDLDKLAKELEEEAKREEAGQAPAAAAPSPATAPTQPMPAPEAPKA